jgi:hypothetical protein
MNKQQLQQATDEQLQIPWRATIKHHDPRKSQDMSRAQMIAEITAWS